MKTLDVQQRRVLMVDLSAHKRYDAFHTNHRSTMGRSSETSRFTNQGEGKEGALPKDEDYLRLFYYLCHSCLFDHHAVENGVVVVVDLNYIGPVDYRSAFPSKVRKRLIEVTNGISCFKMKGCFLLHEPWWVKGMLAMVAPFFGTKKLRARIKKRGKQYQQLAEELGRNENGGGGGGGGSGGSSGSSNPETPIEAQKGPEDHSKVGLKPVNVDKGVTVQKNKAWTNFFPIQFCNIGTNKAGDHWLKVSFFRPKSNSVNVFFYIVVL
jgi:hypothetical protein